MEPSKIQPDDVLKFWFGECSPKQWFQKDAPFDKMIRERFIDVYWRVVKGETDAWRETAEGRLAEIIVLDQFARNMFRGTAQSFLYDSLALSLAQEVVRRGDDQRVVPTQRNFFYTPYMHSESRLVHERALELYQALGDAKYEILHKEIIDRFGRFPHRNAILGRPSTPEEVEFLKEHKGF